MESKYHTSPEKIKVLLYHLVVNDKTFCGRNKYMSVHVDEFRKHLSFLERYGYTPITFEDYHLFLSGDINLPKKPIVITFDDGYSETAKFTLPLLNEFGMKAVYFVIGDRKIKTSIWDIDYCGESLPLMTDEQILELHQAGFEIGSHSFKHGKLTALSHEESWEEISRSRMSLEILLNAPVRSFAYPYGLVNEETKNLVKDAGYIFGCSTYTGTPRFGLEKFEIRRILIPSGIGTTGFASRVFLPYQYYNYFNWKLKLMLFPKSIPSNRVYESIDELNIDKIHKPTDKV
jgi:peptidoglycan/xylan/chitin deacetylase (PgdA/CDA1 family)